MSTIGNTLRREVEQYARTMAASNGLFIAAQNGAVTRQQVQRYLSGLLFQIRGTMRVLRRAECRAQDLGNRELAAHYRRKLEEERGHDRWALLDLASLSARNTQYAADGTPSALGNLVAYLDNVVLRDPCDFLAYILLAEYLTVLVGPSWLRAIESRCGVPTSSMSVVANHVELDREHVERGSREIDTLVTSIDKLQPMVEVLRTSISYYEQFWDEILASATKAA